MGLIKELGGVDFIIQSKTLTDAEEKALSAFIAASKEKHAKRLKARIARSATMRKKKAHKK